LYTYMVFEPQACANIWLDFGRDVSADADIRNEATFALPITRPCS
jgi:hypothetical protein